jgi:hypothetical protein
MDPAQGVNFRNHGNNMDLRQSGLIRNAEVTSLGYLGMNGTERCEEIIGGTKPA